MSAYVCLCLCVVCVFLFLCVCVCVCLCVVCVFLFLCVCVCSPPGCCDGNPADDLRLPNGTVLREVEDIPAFLQSWMVATSEETDYFRRVGDNCTTGNCSKCFTMLNQRPFSQCHHKVAHTHAHTQRPFSVPPCYKPAVLICNK